MKELSNKPGEWLTGFWIETYSGKHIDPVDPKPEDIDINDIAHALSNSCRFTGHTKEFYSVAQHSVLCSWSCQEYPLEALLHDASEAYLSDLARPVKMQPMFKEVYGAAEDKLMQAIAAKFGFAYPLPKPVKIVDDMVLRAEARDLLPNSSGWWKEGGLILNKPINPWNPEKAELLFLDRFSVLTKLS